MRRKLLEKVQAAVEEWARIHKVEIIVNKARYSGIGENIHILVVARKGFESWSNSDRHSSLFQYIYKSANTNGDLVISRLSMRTEEEYDKYYDLEV